MRLGHGPAAAGTCGESLFHGRQPRNRRFPPEKRLAPHRRAQGGQGCISRRLEDFAKKSECRAYRYEGKLNGIESAAASLPHPKDSFGKPAALRAFICADASLGIEAMLYYYGDRRRIETLFLQAKGGLGFGKSQIRSIKGMERL
ncbi:MAG: hypothetical protein LBU32_28640 [Clostridiales bacterium]|jgi:hypothetical protein|nr:hypothetical protein [Clostridiales bacterium]